MKINKKLIATLSAFVLLVSGFSMTVVAETFPCTGVITGDNVNVRAGAGTDREILTQASKGITLTFYGKYGNWYMYKRPNGVEGYICGDYVSTRAEDIASRGNISGGDRVVQLAKQYLGVPYVYGGSSPSGFDCSGFTSYIYRQLGYNINRVAHDQLANGVPVSKSELRPGDLVLFMRAGNTYVNHVGIYAGDGMMIHAPQTGDVVKYTSITTGYYNNCYYAARRIIH